MKSICFITSNHIESNPRLVKEAVAAFNAGYKVKVIFAQALKRISEHDEKIVASYPGIQFEKYVYFQKSPQKKFFLKINKNLCKIWFFFGSRNPEILGGALCLYYRELLELARRDSFDLYVGHNLSTLPLVRRLSLGSSKPFGFDLEDAYSLEKHSPLVLAIIKQTEKMFLKEAAYLTAASPFYIDYYYSKYGLRSIQLVLNTFEQRAVSFEAIDKKGSGERLRLCWFSQAIGLDRGLQMAILAMNQVSNVELHLFGDVSEGVKRELLGAALSSEVKERVYFHGHVQSQNLPEVISSFDIGLAFENNKLDGNENRNLCITNKIFFYVVCCLPVIATFTKGQNWIFQKTSEIGFQFENGNVAALILILKQLTFKPGFILELRKKVQIVARELFNWEKEQAKFLNCLEEVLF